MFCDPAGGGQQLVVPHSKGLGRGGAHEVADLTLVQIGKVRDSFQIDAVVAYKLKGEAPAENNRKGSCHEHL